MCICVKAKGPRTALGVAALFETGSLCCCFAMFVSLVGPCTSRDLSLSTSDLAREALGLYYIQLYVSLEMPNAVPSLSCMASGPPLSHHPCLICNFLIFLIAL